MARDNTRRPGIGRIACHIFQIEPVEMREPAVPALHRDGTTADRDIMWAQYAAVPARCSNSKRPDRPGSGPGKLPGLIYVFNPGTKTRVAPQASQVTSARLGIAWICWSATCRQW